MAKLSNPFLRKIIRILPIEKSFFVSVEIPNVRLTKEIVLLNYGRLSPFGSSDVTFIKRDNRLYLWFFEKNTIAGNFVIPEGYLLFSAYAEEKKDLILVVRLEKAQQGDEYVVTVIKEGRLEAQFKKKGINDMFLEALKRKYNMPGAELLSRKRNDITYSLKFYDIFGFLSFGGTSSLKNRLSDFLEALKMPLIALLVIVNAANLILYSYTSKLVSEKKSQLNMLEKKNKGIKDKFIFLEKESAFLNGFYSNEISYPNLYAILAKVTEIIGKNDGVINSYRQSYRIVDLLVVSPSTARIVNDFIASGLFESAKILSVSQYSEDKSKEVGSIELIIKRFGKTKNG